MVGGGWSRTNERRGNAEREGLEENGIDRLACSIHTASRHSDVVRQAAWRILTLKQIDESQENRAEIGRVVLFEDAHGCKRRAVSKGSFVVVMRLVVVTSVNSDTNLRFTQGT